MDTCHMGNCVHFIPIRKCPTSSHRKFTPALYGAENQNWGYLSPEFKVFIESGLGTKWSQILL